MATVLTQSQSSNNIKDNGSLKSSLLQKFQSIYREIVSKVDKSVDDSVSSSLFYDYHKQISELVRSTEVFIDNRQQISDQQQISSLGSQDIVQNKKIPEQPSYLFLRNIWLAKNEKHIMSPLTYDPQDHIDRINKAVAMIRQQTVYMTKKQNYLYEKQDSNHALLNENPFFIRVKQQLQKIKMQNQQLRQQSHSQLETIQRLNKDKLLLENSLRSYKKKFQQMEKSWIEVSKKNICLQQESLVLKSQNSRSRLNMMRESGDFTNVQMKQSIVIANNGHRKLTEQIINQQALSMTQSINKKNNKTLTNSISTDILRPLDNVFIDIKLKQSHQYLQSPKTIYNNRYGNSNKMVNTENQQSQQGDNEQEYLKDVTQRVNSNYNNNDNNKNSENQSQLQLSHSDKLITEATTTLKFRNIRNETSARKTLLLSSARSVDLSSKTSLNKPKFERTRQNNNNLQQSLLKSVNNSNNDISIEINIEKPTISKNQFVSNSNSQQPHVTSNLVKSFRNQPRSFLSSRREEVK